MLNIVLFGPPGAGKGTQSAKILEKYGLLHLSTGDLLRGELKAESPLGLEAKKYMNEGKLVPDEVLIGMVSNKVATNKDAKGFIFDGFPRTTVQAEALSKIMADNKLEISGMVALEVTEEELTQRILERGKTSGRADDQNEELIRNRFMNMKPKQLLWRISTKHKINISRFKELVQLMRFLQIFVKRLIKYNQN